MLDAFLTTSLHRTLISATLIWRDHERERFSKETGRWSAKAEPKVKASRIVRWEETCLHSQESITELINRVCNEKQIGWVFYLSDINLWTLRSLLYPSWCCFRFLFSPMQCIPATRRQTSTNKWHFTNKLIFRDL